MNNASVKERLIEAGVAEFCENGIRNFSTRRVATRCGVSCAAPYKHFADQQELIHSVLDHIKQEWFRRQKLVEEQFVGNTRQQLVEISRAYIRFLRDYPSFRSFIMIRESDDREEYQKARTDLSDCSKRLIAQYSREVGLSPESALRKTYIVRSLIYGAALMLDNGELPDTAASHEFILHTIQREFDLP